ncbi:Bifunctional monodehydroascorbate reductase and carbonic anhydrase nectarin-3 [Gracilariopsis chorda]|uniref:Carbonic anhydrase n=1 Tax=Gracilariopsis chorda TaxID=448386 RepID=A0A2V3IJK6_9FLOR|nr:Bifunctional monodehydroascorbate reductase and carbonic anhydrase nectarin-3 [Gracilariopsis chorda]|eukprot:PXF42239.1 Bifunctional monodehydroascorbate reductase and carbonic anhydrase nectarin-3 [Gracilariopsis chorda]
MKYIAILSLLCLSAQLTFASVLYQSVVRSRESSGYTYDRAGTNGPVHWGSISTDYRKCSSGHHQSPINVALSKARAYPMSNKRAPRVRLLPAKFSFENGTENFALHCDDSTSCGYTTFAGTRYQFVNLHFHSPSEHTINGKHFPLEAHMVHESADGAKLVVSTLFRDPAQSDDLDGILLTRGARRTPSSTQFHSILNHIDSRDTQFSVHTPAFMGSAGYCTYTGSLTTPPCTEDVTWLIALQEQPIHISDVEVYQKYSVSTQFHNNRPVHPLNSREIICYHRPGLITRSGSFYHHIQQFLDGFTW